MLQRYFFHITCPNDIRNLELQKDICELVGYRKEGEVCPTSEKGKQKWNRRLSEEEWSISAELLELLQLPYQIMIDLQSETIPTLSRVAPAVVSLRTACQNLVRKFTSAIARRVAASIFTSLNSRFSKALDQPIYSIATFVDPQTKHMFRILPQSTRDCTVTFIRSMVDLSEPTDESSEPVPVWFQADPSATRQRSNAISTFDVNLYLSSPSGPVQASLPRQLPIIQDLYYELCGIPATSSDVERLFSTCGYVNSQRRCSLKPESVEQQSLLKKNARVIENFTDALYPESTSKLTNWLDTLPTTMNIPFFNGDDDLSMAAFLAEDADVSLMEAISASSSSDDSDLIPNELSDPYWSHSTRPHNFSQQVAAIQPGTKRKRGNEDKENNEDRRKRQKTTEFIPVIYPSTGQRVYIHYTDDCVCGLNDKRKCTCDLWFAGVVQYREEDNKEGKQSFVVKFDDAEEAGITWEVEGKNDWWLTCKK